MDIVFLKSAFQESHYPLPDKPEIAFAGRSNVGKSSLINVLVNRKGIAKTSSKPGRTQAINFFCVEDRFNMVDLPGYGYARVPLPVKKSWGKMVETYLRERSTLKAVVVILDIRRDPNAGDRELLNWLSHYGINVIVVLTKADKLSRHQAGSRAKLIEGQLAEFAAERPVMYSSKTREGREEIWKRINRITDHKP
ncbi:ribosome biogenesis GTP-binding protein YihA/YsxC [bacterium]|nr:ribosome biogenesis GTP-binding protein YihA/YsxC [bacterium]